MFQWLRHPSAVLAAGLVLLLVVLLTAMTVSEGERRDQRLVQYTLGVEARVATLRARLEGAEARQREFVITGDPKYLADLRAEQATIRRELAGLATATQDNADQRAAMARLRLLLARRFESLDRGIALRRSEGPAAAAAYIMQGRGIAIMDRVRAELDGMRATESKLLQVRQAHAASTRRILRVVVGAALLSLLALTAYAVIGSAGQLRRMRESHDELAAANERLTAEASARERAEGEVRQLQKMQAVGQLTGGIAHDFNNMLAVIIGSLDLARRRLRAEPERAETCIDNALDAAQRAAGLTARLLAFSRQQPLAPTPLDPNKLVGGMSELLRRTLGEQVEVETVLAGGLWRVNVDAQQLESALVNLGVNARDAMPNGGKLTVESSNAFLDEDYADGHVEVHAGQYVLISVTDTGEGMPEEVIARAFDPFYTTKGVGRGTGLGLSQVFGFVKQSGGHIKIYSEVGIGTSVKIYLPRWTGDLPADDGHHAPTTSARAQDNEIILVVEDDPQVRHVTVDALRELGYTVVQAGSGEEALQQLALQPRVDLLLTDIVMSGMTGRVLADAATADRPGLKVLYMTGYTRNAVVHNGVLDAGVAFLQKPFTGEQLGAKVRQVLDGRGASR